MKGDFSILEVLAIELKVWRPNHQCHAFRLETRARECAVLASLSRNGEGEGKPNSRSFVRSQEKRVKVR